MSKKNGSITVAATMFIAHRAGIKVFVTGGIWGVDYGNDMDISGDLIELHLLLLYALMLKVF